MRLKLSLIKRVYKYWLIYSYHLNSVTLFKRQGNKRIIICMNGIISHGGLVDRFKGIVSFYEISRILNYDFYIQFTSPFNLEEFFGENTYNWKVKDASLRWNFFSTKFLYLMNRFDANPLEIIQKTKCKDIFVYSNVNYMSSIYIKENDSFCDEKIRKNFEELFKENKTIQEFLSVYNKPRITYHARFTSLMGDFKDTANLELTEDEKVKLKHEVLEMIKNHSFQLKNDYEIYVLSDSVNFLDFVENNSDYKVLGGKPMHIDLKKAEEPEEHIKTFLDFFFILNSNLVFQVKKGDMYNSNFSKYAAILGEKKYEIIS
jgi:hypothetical protein